MTRADVNSWLGEKLQMCFSGAGGPNQSEKDTEWLSQIYQSEI